jgi:hypothetical protein
VAAASSGHHAGGTPGITGGTGEAADVIGGGAEVARMAVRTSMSRQ